MPGHRIALSIFTKFNFPKSFQHYPGKLNLLFPFSHPKNLSVSPSAVFYFLWPHLSKCTSSITQISLHCHSWFTYSSLWDCTSLHYRPTAVGLYVHSRYSINIFEQINFWIMKNQTTKAETYLMLIRVLIRMSSNSVIMHRNGLFWEFLHHKSF
jgi:hypothetical protein